MTMKNYINDSQHQGKCNNQRGTGMFLNKYSIRILA